MKISEPMAKAPKVEVHGREFSLLIDEETLERRISEMARLISRDYSGSDVLLVPVLNGAFIFAADLVRELDFDPELHFVTYRSYSGMESTGVIKEVSGLASDDVAGRDVLIVEDIVDTGRTLTTLRKDLLKQGANSVRTAALLCKPGKLQIDCAVEYVGFEIGDAFVIGCGLDFDGHGRSLRGIYQSVD